MNGREATVQAPSLWHNRAFRSLWAAQAVSQFGDRITELALPLIAVVVLRATPNEVAFVTAAVWLPNLLGLFLGAWVDHRRHKRRLLVAADVLRAVVLLSLPVAYVFDAVSLGQLYAVALLIGAGEVLFNMANAPFFVSLVPRASYIEANSKLSATRSISFIAGPAVGGVLIQVLTAPVAVFVDAVSFLASALFLGRIPVKAQSQDNEGQDTMSVLQRARDGLRFVLHHPVLRASLGCATTVNFFTFMSGALLVLYASRSLELASGLIGLAFGIGAAGGLLGALLAPAVSRRIGVGHTIVIGAILFPAPIALAALAGGPVWARSGALAAAELLSSMGVMLFDVPLNALQTTVIPDGMRSRVAGAFTAVNYGIRPLGAVVGGVLGTSLGLRPTLLIAAAGGTLSFLWLLPSPIPGFRSLDDEGCPATRP
jgi:MFS family permease